MHPDDFRSMALSLPDTVESSHMSHPDFRVQGRIFASLGYPSSEWGVVRLSPDEQARVCGAEPEVFVPVKGAWGAAGNTQVFLRLARKRSVRAALRAAWRNRVDAARPASDAKSADISKRRPGASARRRA